MIPEETNRIRLAVVDAIGENDPEGSAPERAAVREQRLWDRIALLRGGDLAAADRRPDELRGDLTDEIAALLRSGHASNNVLNLIADFLQHELTDDALIGRLLGVQTAQRPKSKSLLEARCVVAFELALAAGRSDTEALAAAYDTRKDAKGAYRADSAMRKTVAMGAKQVEITAADDYIRRHVRPVLKRAGLLELPTEKPI